MPGPVTVPREGDTITVTGKPGRNDPFPQLMNIIESLFVTDGGRGLTQTIDCATVVPSKVVHPFRGR